MIAKDRLLSIPNLNLAGKIENMDDEQMQQYEQALISFIESFPANEQKIKDALDVRNAEAITSSLTAVCETLEKIYADDIADECYQSINRIKVSPYEAIEAFVTEFLQFVASLSIDIQMVKYMERREESHSLKKADADKIILAVDDAAISLTVLRKNMQGSPYKLVCVNSGEDALRYLKHHDPDLFILDIEMPKMNGYELAEKIRESGQKAPIIFLTGNATKKNVMRAIEAGGCDFIVKPANKEYIAYKINKYL
jgi:CheY-like chemotaxis protein